MITAKYSGGLLHLHKNVLDVDSKFKQCSSEKSAEAAISDWPKVKRYLEI
jgi:hypothetical protein